MARDTDSTVTRNTTGESAACSDGHDPTRPAPKRRRIALACSACRIRKSKCNGVRPKCEPCGRLDFECIYELPDTSANLIVPRDLFAALEDRVRWLEADLKKHGERLAAVEHATPRNHGALGGDAFHRDALSMPSPVATSTFADPGSVIIRTDGIHEAATDQSMADGMAVSFVDEQDCGFFGPSSNIAFMRHILRAMPSTGKATADIVSPKPSPRTDLYESGIINVSRPVTKSLGAARTRTVREIDTNILPADNETQRLIHSYFSNTGLLFPFIHEDCFLKTYYRLRQSGFSANVRRTWLGLLNMVLAMAVRTGNSAGDSTEYKPEQSDIFYQRAEELCKYQTQRGTTLETVQYLLLTSQYLQSTQKSVQTWTAHGLAVKAALSIGLHSRDAMAKFPPIEQEMRKRTWYGCVLLDRSLSMTFGRPGAIPEDYVKLDLPLALPSRVGDADALGRTSTSFFTSTILLYRSMSKTLATLYGHNLGCDAPPPETWVVSQIFQLEQELSDWQNSLVAPLFLWTAADLAAAVAAGTAAQCPYIERFRVVLTLRYLNLQLLVHRPLLTKTLSMAASAGRGGDAGAGRPAQAQPQPQKSSHKMQMNFDQTCMSVAEDIIEIIHLLLTRPGLGRHLTGAWWFTLYYTFNAALAIFGSLLLPKNDFDAKPGQDCLDRGARFLGMAIEALVRLDAENTTVLRCTDYLRQLEGLVLSWGKSSTETPAAMLAGDFLADTPRIPDGHSDLFISLPLFPNLAAESADELELGHFFTTEFQRWLNRNPL